MEYIFQTISGSLQKIYSLLSASRGHCLILTNNKVTNAELHRMECLYILFTHCSSGSSWLSTAYHFNNRLTVRSRHKWASCFIVPIVTSTNKPVSSHLTTWSPMNHEGSYKDWCAWVYSLHQLGCSGCTLEPWCFGFPQQQQLIQVSKMIKRKVAERK